MYTTKRLKLVQIIVTKFMNDLWTKFEDSSVDVPVSNGGHESIG